MALCNNRQKGCCVWALTSRSSSCFVFHHSWDTRRTSALAVRPIRRLRSAVTLLPNSAPPLTATVFMQIRAHIQPAELQITHLTIPPSHSYNQQTDDWCELYYCSFPVMCLWCPTDFMSIAYCSVILNSVLYVGFLDFRTKGDHLVMRSHQPLHLISLYFTVDMTRENKTTGGLYQVCSGCPTIVTWSTFGIDIYILFKYL